MYGVGQIGKPAHAEVIMSGGTAMCLLMVVPELSCLLQIVNHYSRPTSRFCFVCEAHISGALLATDNMADHGLELM